MYTQQQVGQKLKSLGVNRAVSSQDIDNANKYGMQIFDKTFGKSQGVPTNQTPTDNLSATQSGQQAFQSASQPQTDIPAPSLEELKVQENAAIQEQSQLSEQGQAASKLLGQLLEAKQKSVGYGQKIQKIQQKLQARTFKDYIDAGLSFGQALSSFQEDLSRASAKKEFIRNAEKAEQERVDKLTASMAEYFNTQLQGTQYRITNIGNQIARGVQEEQFAAQMAQAARSGGGDGPRTKPTSDRLYTGQRVLRDPYTGAVTAELDPSFESYVQQKQDALGKSLTAEAQQALLPEYQQYIGYNPDVAQTPTVINALQSAYAEGQSYEDMIANYPQYKTQIDDVYKVSKAKNPVEEIYDAFGLNE